MGDGYAECNRIIPRNLYNTIRQDWKCRYTFTFLKSKAEEEASMITDSVILYLLEVYGDKVLQFLNPEIVA